MLRTPRVVKMSVHSPTCRASRVRAGSGAAGIGREDGPCQAPLARSCVPLPTYGMHDRRMPCERNERVQSAACSVECRVQSCAAHSSVCPAYFFSRFAYIV
jgi:hypothetical protein